MSPAIGRRSSEGDSSMETNTLKGDVKSYWEEEVCGTRNLGMDFDRYEANRREFEPYISEFADYGSYKDKKVLEIGIGGGGDYINFLKSGADIIGIDLTEAALDFVASRLQASGMSGQTQIGDAENLSFEDGFFDLVYSYGVLHHSPDTEKALSEAFRVLKQGGELKVMVYSDFSMTGLMLWIIHGLLKGKPFLTQRKMIYRHLESPGTKCYSNAEFKRILEKIGFEVQDIYKKCGTGDLLLMDASSKYNSGLKKTVFDLMKRLLPRGLIMKNENTLGLFLLVKAVKP